MGKDKSEAEVRAKKDKKDKKRKAEDADDVEPPPQPKKSKKDKKSKSDAARAPVDEGSADVDGQSLIKVEETKDDKDEQVAVVVPLAALVPFANPLADEKSQKKVLRAVKKGTLPPTPLLIPCHC